MVGMPGDAISSANFQNLVHDLALLSSLGIKLIIVHGARPQIEEALDRSGLKSNIHNQIRVTPADQLLLISSTIHQAQDSIISAFSRGMPHMPGFGLQTSVVSGNFVTARPLGVKEGVDYQYTGQVRVVNTDRIVAALNTHSIVLIPTLGYSITGEIFNLSISEVTSKTTKALKADKLICLSTSTKLSLLHESNESVFNINQLENVLADQPEPDALFRAAVSAISEGLARAHIVDFETEGALLEELFTPKGSGLMIVEEDIERVRTAVNEDIGGILKIIAPMEIKGQLVRRDRDSLEENIDCFRVIDIDGMVIASAALFQYPQEKVGELACLAIHPDFQKGGRGAKLLRDIENWALSVGLEKLVSLTTEGAHWFIGQGFSQTDLSALPKKRQALYDSKRASKVFIKSLKT